MPGFKVSSIREQFVLDTAQMLRETVAAAKALLRKRSADPAAQYAIIKRHGHSLRGLAGLVDAHGLERWGFDLEDIAMQAEAAATPAVRGMFLQCIIDHEADWSQMIELSTEENHAEAWEVYQQFRGRLPALVRGFLREKAQPGINIPQAVTPALRTKQPDSANDLGAITTPTLPLPLTPPLRLKTAAPAVPSPAAPTLRTKEQSPVTAQPAIPAPTTPALRGKQTGPVPAAPNVPKLRGKSTGPSPAAPVTPNLKARAVPAPSKAESEQNEMLEFFVEDAEDQLRSLERAVLRWEQQDDPLQQRQAVRRAFHTLKGAANSIGLTKLGSEFHVAEDYIEGVGEGVHPVSLPLFQFLLGSVDQLRGLLRSIAATGQADWPHDWSAALKRLGQSDEAGGMELELPSNQNFTDDGIQEISTIRVDSQSVSRLGSLLSEIVTDRRRVENRFEQLRNLTRLMRERTALLNRTVGNFQKQFEFQLIGDKKSQPSTQVRSMNQPGQGGEFSELEFDRYDEASILARSLAELASDFDQLLGEWNGTLHDMEGDASQFKQTSRAVQDAVAGLSLVAFDEVVPRLQRVFRDALGVEDRAAVLEFSGTETLVEKGLVERIYPALLHLLRNAVAHGIEPAAERAAAGKPAMGQVRVSCAQVSNQILVRLEDDGRGLNEPAIRARAISLGLLGHTEETLRNSQILRLICNSGFTTADKVTNVSGRGVGMDVVRSEVEALKGSLDLAYKPGSGTTWTIRLPLTLSITEGVIVQSGQQSYALPVNAVLGALMLHDTPTEIRDGRVHASYGGEMLPVIHLGTVLGPGEHEEADYGLAISNLDRKAILAVHQLLGRAELPMKSLDPVTACHPLFESATIDPMGIIVPVLSASAIMDASETGVRPNLKTARSIVVTVDRPRILVVDDSVSVRRVQQRMLESLGCEVVAATDGLHALESLRQHDFHMILTDLEMPRLNGFELIAEIRSNPVWASIPTIVISSRSADKYVAKAMNLGATSFLFKPFTEMQISSLLNHHLRRKPAAA